MRATLLGLSNLQMIGNTLGQRLYRRYLMYLVLDKKLKPTWKYEWKDSI